MSVPRIVTLIYVALGAGMAFLAIESMPDYPPKVSNSERLPGISGADLLRVGGVEAGSPSTVPAAGPRLERLEVRDRSGRMVDLVPHLESRRVVIDIWATWCGPCLAELPVLDQLAERYAGKVQLVGILTDTVDSSEREEVTFDFVDQLDLGYDSYFATETTLAQLSETCNRPIGSRPTKLFLDGDRKVVWWLTGAQDLKVYRRLIENMS